MMKNGAAFVIACVLLLGSSIFVYQSFLFQRNNARPSYKAFPNRIGSWIGEDLAYDTELLGELYSDKIIYKKYARHGKPSIVLFIACYESLEGVDNSHSPIVCFSGQGWIIEDTAKDEIVTNISENARIEVNRLITSKGNRRTIALFWFQSADKAFSNRAYHKLSLFLDAVSGKPAPNAFVRVTVSVSHGFSDRDAITYLCGFVKDMYSDLKAFVS